MNINGLETTINFSGDIRMDPYWKKWTIEDIFTCIRKTKGGLIILKDPDGKECQLRKRNINALSAINGNEIE